MSLKQAFGLPLQTWPTAGSVVCQQDGARLRDCPAVAQGWTGAACRRLWASRLQVSAEHPPWAGWGLVAVPGLLSSPQPRARGTRAWDTFSVLPAEIQNSALCQGFSRGWGVGWGKSLLWLLSAWHGITEWFGLRILKLISFPAPAMARNTFHPPRLLQALSWPGTIPGVILSSFTLWLLHHRRGVRPLFSLWKQEVNPPKEKGGPLLKIPFSPYCRVLPWFLRQWRLLALGGWDLTSGKFVSCGWVTLIGTSCRSGLCELNQGVINNLTTSLIYRWSVGEVWHRAWENSSFTLFCLQLAFTGPVPPAKVSPEPVQGSGLSVHCRGLWLWTPVRLTCINGVHILYYLPVEQCQCEKTVRRKPFSNPLAFLSLFY